MVRCGQCKHWKKDDDLMPGTGRCEELSRPPAILYPATPLPVQVLGVREGRATAVSQSGAYLLTAQTFGCVQGELR